MSAGEFLGFASTITLSGAALFFFLWGVFEKERFRTMMTASAIGALGLSLLGALVEYFS